MNINISFLHSIFGLFVKNKQTENQFKKQKNKKPTTTQQHRPPNWIVEIEKEIIFMEFENI